MTLKGIDIASWQSDLIPISMTDTDFIIVKATGGVSYNNPSFTSHMTQSESAKKLLGCYHFAQEKSSPGTAQKEADHFIEAFKPWIGKAIPFLDWEADALNLPVSWAKEWLDRVYEQTGVIPGIYMSKSVCRQFDWSSVASKYFLWVAQYANMNETGWQSDPWTDNNGYGAWSSPTIFQYSSTGKVVGYNNNLDINVFYGDREDWVAKCQKASSENSQSHNESIVDAVIHQVQDKIETEVKMTSVANIAATIHADMCDDDRNGYSWSPRWGGDSPHGSKTLNIDGRNYTYALGSYDCSSSVITAWKLALQYTSYAGVLDGATYTGNMLSVFRNSGLFDVWDTNSTNAVRGDVYLNESSHTALCQDGGSDGVYGYDALSEFSINEFGDVYNGQVGDQTGREAYIHGYYSFAGITLHYNGKADASNGSSGSDNTYVPPNYDAPIPDVTFRVKVGSKWLGKNVPGEPGSAITGIAIDFNGHGWYQVCTKKHGWLDKVTGYNIDDEENGYAGYEDSPVIAVRCYYDTPNPGETGYFLAKYHAAEIGQDYFDWQYDDDMDNGQDGYAGDMNPIDRFEILLCR